MCYTQKKTSWNGHFKTFLTLVLNSQGRKKCAMHRKKSWYGHYSSFLIKLSCSRTALKCWIKKESHWNTNLVSQSSPDWTENIRPSLNRKTQPDSLNGASGWLEYVVGFSVYVFCRLIINIIINTCQSSTTLLFNCHFLQNNPCKPTPERNKTIQDFNKARDAWLAVASVDHMQIICTSLQTDNHVSSSSLNYYRPTINQ